MEEESDKMDLILDYYKDWDSHKAPVMMSLEVTNELSESLEAEDDRRLKALRIKMRKKLG
ncbi:MAG: hypothetical protein CEE43_02885 [Promethearchaeota archaeon Loki_b32]|nr:MAG: hypothetical protein CEE43_02885 [Candidatus Lokiarchaeota archaeon Loki_b32]